jgi:hypothetical protein
MGADHHGLEAAIAEGVHRGEPRAQRCQVGADAELAVAEVAALINWST